jgi:sphinganine-1-phosphate aldolase
MYFAYADWPGGLYVTPSTAGSKPGALIAACWVSLMRMGEEGYMTATQSILETVDRMRRSVPCRAVARCCRLDTRRLGLGRL